MATETIDQDLAKQILKTSEISSSSPGFIEGVWPAKTAPDIDQIEVRILAEVEQTIEWTKNQKTISFSSFEKALRAYIFLLARLFISLFLCGSVARILKNNIQVVSQVINGRNQPVVYWEHFSVKFATGEVTYINQGQYRPKKTKHNVQV